MTNENKNERYQTTLDLEKGTVTIDILDLLRNLNDEQRDELVWDGGYWPFISPELLKDISDTFSGKSYNNTIHKLREDLLSSEYAPELIKNFVKGLVRDFVSDIQYKSEYEKAYWKIFHDKHFQKECCREIIRNAHTRSDVKTARTEFVSDFIDKMIESNDINFENIEQE